MPIQPRTEQQIYEELRADLVSGTDKVSNFTSGSFNEEFLRAYAQQVREVELKMLAAELSGYIDYAGGGITENSLRTLGIENVAPEEVNQYMSEESLDYLASNLGVDRDPGVRATGTVTFDVAADDVAIPQGYVVSTDPGSVRGQLDFLVDPNGDGDVTYDNTVTASPDSGEKTVTVDVVAEESGEEYNIPAGGIQYLPNPKPGVQDVTNTSAFTGGENAESNTALRETAKNIIFTSSEGGTKSGVETFIQNNSTTGVKSVSLDEFTNVQPPYVDVVVDGGERNELLELINESKSYGIQYNLIRPTVTATGIHTNIIGSDIDTTVVTETIISYFAGRTIGDPFYLTPLINDISAVDTQIRSVPGVNTYHNDVDNEDFIYDSTESVYTLEYGPFGRVRDEEHYVTSSQQYETVFNDVIASSVSVEVIEDDVDRVLADSEFSVLDTDTDGNNDTIEFDNSVSVDSGTTIRLDYNHNDWAFGDIETPDGSVFTQGTDYELIDNDGDGLTDSINWLSGSTPADGDRFIVTYQPNRSFTGDLFSDDRTKMDIDTDGIDIRVIQP